MARAGREKKPVARQPVSRYSGEQPTGYPPAVTSLIIYDCDGTLIDTETIYGEVALEAIRALGLPGWDMHRYVQTMVGIPYPQCWDAVVESYGGPLPDGFHSDLNARIDARFAAGVAVLPGVVETVPMIEGPRCVASSTGLPALRRNLGIAGIAWLFEPAIFSASQVKRGKPAPDVFLHAAAQMGHDPADCLVIEDSVPGVEAARRAGMRVVGFTGASHDPAWLEPRLRAAGALEVVPEFAQLAGVVQALR
jgi:HAD superfamily hydrolase (TIGR01509 family)